MNSQDNGQRTVLPTPDQRRTGLVTYDAKDPDTKFPPIAQLRPPQGAPNVLIVGDSFTGHLRPFFDATFQSVTVTFNTGQFPLEEIRQQRPALVVYETAERFLGHR